MLRSYNWARLAANYSYLFSELLLTIKVPKVKYILTEVNCDAKNLASYAVCFSTNVKYDYAGNEAI